MKAMVLKCVAVACVLASAMPAQAQAPQRITQLDDGRLVGDFIRITTPIREVDLGVEARFRGLRLSPDGTKLIADEFIRGKDGGMRNRIAIRDVRTGNVERSILENPGIPVTPVMPIFLDARTYLFWGKEGGFATYAADTGALIRSYAPPAGQQDDNDFFVSGDGNTFAAGTAAGGAIVWNIKTGKADLVDLGPDIANRPRRLIPLAGGQGLLLGVGNPDATPPTTELRLISLPGGKAQTLVKYAEAVEFLPTADGKQVLIMRLEKPGFLGWTSIEQWDIATMKLVRRQALAPPLTAISARVSRDGRFLFIHEYMMQPIVLWDLVNGKLVATVAPKAGGCEAFDVTPDGKTLVAKVGTWREGTLIPRKLAVYDISKVTALAGAP